MKLRDKTLLQSLSEEIMSKQEKYPKTVIFVTDYKHCFHLYFTICSRLGKYLNFTVLLHFKQAESTHCDHCVRDGH